MNTIDPRLQQWLRIPEELRRRNQWVAWSSVNRGGNDTKLPINPHTGQLARVNDPSTWGSFEQAVAAAEGLDGIGYVFSADDPYCGIDIDSTPDISMLRWFDSYAERSVSGNGAHVIVRAKVDQGRHREHGTFSERRYFVMTGDVLLDRPIREAQDEVDQFVAAMLGTTEQSESDTPASQQTREAILERIRASHQWTKFQRLWNGDTSDYPSASEADAALLSMLRYWTGGDRALSFQLFSESALGRRAKWLHRLDYRERTWRAIDRGDVFELKRAAQHTPPPIVTTRLSPWRNVTSDDVRRVIEGTQLDVLVRVLESPMSPTLPLEATLIKAIILAGCALSDRDPSVSELTASVGRAHDLARLKILTAGGQVCNVYGLLVARSGIGKDVGGLMDTLALQREWMIGTAGSAEGLADTLASDDPFRGNGYIGIDEFSTWLDKRHWQSHAAGFLTSAFSRGWFSISMSRRNGMIRRECRYCFPSILANVQPAALSRFASLIDIGTGFLSRFIVSRVPDDYYGRPVCAELDTASAHAALDCFAAKRGVVEVGDKYLQDLYDEFRAYKAAIRSHWGRLVNEYGPRIAVMLSVRDDSPDVVLTDREWRGAATILRWFYAQAESVLTQIHEDERTARRESLIQRIYDRIARTGSATATEITRSVQRGTTQRMRAEAIDELIARGLIRVEQQGRGVRYVVVGPGAE